MEDSYRCEGEGICDAFTAVEGTFEEKSMVCLDCKRCNGKAPLRDGVNAPEQIDKQIIQRTEFLIRQQNAGMLDLSSLDYEEWRFMEIWRDEERIQDMLHKQRIAAMFEAMSRQA